MVEWNEDQRGLRQALQSWCTRFGTADEDKTEPAEADVFPHEKWKLVCESGLLRLPFGEPWGGLGADLLTTMYVLEELGNSSRDGGLNFAISTHMVSSGVPIERFGSSFLKKRYLPRICDGSMIGGHAITESGHGSDVLGMRTTARPDDDMLVLNGIKEFVTNGPVADVFVVYARTGAEDDPLGLSAVVVPRDTPGLSVGSPIRKMGLRSSPLGGLSFDDCKVPLENVIGSIGSGFLILEYVLKWEILCSFSIALGEMRHRFDRCVEHARSRRQFGQPIGNYQAVSHKIVNMKIDTETAAKWLYDTAEKIAHNEDADVDVAIVKIITSEANVSSALAAVQIFGGYGYMTEYGLEEQLRDAVSGTIYSGTSEIQRNRVASMIGL